MLREPKNRCCVALCYHVDQCMIIFVFAPKSNYTSIIHVKISYNSEILKDWEGLPIEK